MITVGTIVEAFEQAFPEAKDLLSTRQMAFLLKAAIDAKEADDRTGQPEIVRVIRLYVFEGPRAKVEQQLLRSQADGTKQWGDLTLHAATIGTFPEIMRKDSPVVDTTPKNND